MYTAGDILTIFEHCLQHVPTGTMCTTIQQALYYKVSTSLLMHQCGGRIWWYGGWDHSIPTYRDQFMTDIGLQYAVLSVLPGKESDQTYGSQTGSSTKKTGNSSSFVVVVLLRRDSFSWTPTSSQEVECRAQLVLAAALHVSVCTGINNVSLCPSTCRPGTQEVS